jgi:hypothetical protein
VCPARYRTQHFFNNFAINEDIATKFEADLSHCIRNMKEKNVLLFKFHCNILIGVKIIKEKPGSVASGTLCIRVECKCILIKYLLVQYQSRFEGYNWLNTVCVFSKHAVILYVA